MRAEPWNGKEESRHFAKEGKTLLLRTGVKEDSLRLGGMDRSD